MLRYIITSISLLAGIVAHAQVDTTAPKKPMPGIQVNEHQLRVGYDISRPIINAMLSDKSSQEFQIDYYGKNTIYWALEAGVGTATNKYSDLAYTSSNTFLRVGFDKSLLQRLYKSDWDVVTIGLRYGIASINRSAATYTMTNTLYGNTTGSVPGKTSVAQWLEITGGLKVELVKGVFAGWNIRGKFLLNQSVFKELPPSFVGGYGKGDKTSIFDFNFYISYAFRWKKDAK